MVSASLRTAFRHSGGLLKWLRTLLAALLALAAGIAGLLTYCLFLSPASHTPDTADAIVVLAGGSGERLPRALHLMSTGVAASLVVSVGGEDWPTQEAKNAAREICADQTLPFRIHCRKADPDSTRGEGRTFSSMATEQGWNRLIVVTSDYHLFRSTRWFSRCFAGEVFGVAAPATPSVKLLVHEWLGVLAQSTIRRSCDFGQQ